MGGSLLHCSAMAEQVPTQERAPEVWLKTNRRALAAGLGVDLLLLLCGVSLVLLDNRWGGGGWLRLAGVGVIVACGGFAALLLYQMTLPRLAYAHGELQVYLESARPVRVPIDVVELFFLGHGNSHLPAGSERASKSRTVVVRLAEAATEWHNLPIRTPLGEWREAYILVRGTWSEPITPEVIKRLNQRLAAVHRRRRGTSEQEREA